MCSIPETIPHPETEVPIIVVSFVIFLPHTYITNKTLIVVTG